MKKIITWLLSLLAAAVFSLPGGGTVWAADTDGGVLTGEMGCGARWEYDTVSRTLIFSGDGVPLTLVSGDHPVWMDLPVGTIRTVIVGEGILRADYWPVAEKVCIGPDVETVYNQNPPDEFALDPDNPWLGLYKGCLYTSDFTRLFASSHSAGKTFHPNLKVLGVLSLYGNQNHLLVLPRGTEMLDSGAAAQKNMCIVLPDTVTSVGKQRGGGWSEGLTFFYSEQSCLNEFDLPFETRIEERMEGLTAGPYTVENLLDAFYPEQAAEAVPVSGPERQAGEPCDIDAPPRTGRTACGALPAAALPAGLLLLCGKRKRR